MKAAWVLGIMSGTSIDSVDYALCAIDNGRVRLQNHWQTKFPARLQQRLHQAARGACSAHQLCQLHHDLGRFYALNAQNPRARHQPQLVGLHGQTVFHNPARNHPATFQLGEPAYLVERLRAPVVSNFRAADLAAGGQGAPLATIFHQTVFGESGKHVCVNNLGGISNVTSLDWTTRAKPFIMAFDTGPANVLIDLAMRHFSGGKKQMDENGAWASRGHVFEPGLARWTKHPYFKRKPPKSTGRELFGEGFFENILSSVRSAALSKYDIVATLAEFTGRTIALNYERHLRSLPERVILTGGGAANPSVVKSIEGNLQKLSAGIEVLTSEALGWPLQSIEAAAFAFLAWLRIHRKPGNLPQTTGAGRAALLGQISEP
jgi:anhydro-N-acetylmuramic acid kinase